MRGCSWYIVSEARLAQSVERKALNLVVVGSSPTVGDHYFFPFHYAHLITPNAKLHLFHFLFPYIHHSISPHLLIFVQPYLHQKASPDHPTWRVLTSKLSSIDIPTFSEIFFRPILATLLSPRGGRGRGAFPKNDKMPNQWSSSLEATFPINLFV